MKAQTEINSDAHPLSSLLAFWRRFTSISSTNEFAERSFQPAHASDNSTSDIARTSADEYETLLIGDYLHFVEARLHRVKARWNEDEGVRNVSELSDIGHLVAIDVRRLIELVRRLEEGDKTCELTYLVTPNV